MLAHHFQAHTRHFVENFLWFSLMAKGMQKVHHFRTEKLNEKDFYAIKIKREKNQKITDRREAKNNFSSDHSKNKFSTVD